MVTFGAKTSTDLTRIEFDTTFPRKTEVSFAGLSVLRDLFGLGVTVGRLDGDADENALINEADLRLVNRNFGIAGDARADLNEDTVVDIRDLVLVALNFSRAASPAPIPPPAGMVSWWPGDGNARDIVGGNHGTLQGGATFAAGKVGQAFSFNRTGDVVIVGDSPNLDITGDVTVDLWARHTVLNSGDVVLVAKGGDPGPGGTDAVSYGLGFLAAIEQSQPFAGFLDGVGGSSFVIDPSVADTNFHHYAYVRSGNTHKLFLDGVSMGGNPEDTSGVPLLFGGFPDSDDPTRLEGDFAGILDEVEIYNRPLSTGEIMIVFNEGNAGRSAPDFGGRVGFWPGDGSTIDSSGGGNGGILSGDATFTGGQVGQGFSLPSVRGLVLVPDSPALNITGDVTVGLWARRTSPLIGDALMVTKGGPNGVAYGIGLLGEDRPFVFYSGADGSIFFLSGPELDVTQFHHYMYVRSGDRNRLFVDGVEATPRPIASPALPLVIGAVSDAREQTGFNDYFTGIVDEVEIFNRALSDAEVKAIFEAGSAGKRKPQAFFADEVILINDPNRTSDEGPPSSMLGPPDGSYVDLDGGGTTLGFSDNSVEFNLEVVIPSGTQLIIVTLDGFDNGLGEVIWGSGIPIDNGDGVASNPTGATQLLGTTTISPHPWGGEFPAKFLFYAFDGDFDGLDEGFFLSLDDLADTEIDAVQIVEGR